MPGGNIIVARLQKREESMPEESQLIRAIGRWTLVALVLNSIIGSGIFGLPAVVAGKLGAASIWAYLVAAAGIAVIVACFAEVGSQFREAGGPYLYARAGFGRFVGIQVGWLAWLVRLTSAAANANLFILYLAEFWPRAEQPLERAGVLALLLGGLTLANVRGVRTGARLSSIFAIAKLLPLSIFIVAGLAFQHTKAPPDHRTCGHGRLARGAAAPRLRLRRLRGRSAAHGAKPGTHVVMLPSRCSWGSPP